MSLRLLLRERPRRALAVLTNSHALVFRHIQSSTSADSGSKSQTSTTSSPSKCMVEFAAHNDVDLEGYRVLRTSGIHGTLGLININADVFLCVISGAVRVATGTYTLPDIRVLYVSPLFEVDISPGSQRSLKLSDVAYYTALCFMYKLLNMRSS